MHTLIIPFGNIDIILCGNLCQAHGVHDQWIFEQKICNTTTLSYNFWRYNVKCFELHTFMQQESKDLISI